LGVGGGLTYQSESRGKLAQHKKKRRERKKSGDFNPRDKLNKHNTGEGPAQTATEQNGDRTHEERSGRNWGKGGEGGREELT